MAKAVKLADIAKVLGVSTVTVSKALSDQKGVGDDLRAQIKKVASEMGYIPVSTRIQEEKKYYNIGVIVSERYFDQTYSFYWLMYQELATKALNKNCFTLLEAVSIEDENQCNSPKLFDGKRINGLVILGNMSDDYLKMINKEAKVPVVYMDFINKTQVCDSVISNGYGGMYALTDYICSIGHRKIAYVGTLFATDSITDRFFGYCRALYEHGIGVRKEYVLDDRDLKTSEMVDFNEVLPEDMPTAFICNCDFIAAKLIETLTSKGYRVPEDISVTGFDDYIPIGGPDMQLTTYTVDVKEMARRVIKFLVKRMDGNDFPKDISIVNGKVIIGETTCAPSDTLSE